MTGEPEKTYRQENVMTERVDHLIEHRIPWLLIGVLGGLFATVIVSKFEKILSLDARLAFFIPIIVYLSDAVGTQTETIFIRELAKKKLNFTKYILKESLVGLGLGLIIGIILALFAAVWLKSSAIGLTLCLTMIINLTLAPLLAVVIPGLLYKKRSDPALGSGPVATIIQDLISLLTYFIIASLIIF
jgi:magnesium transporter